MCTGLLNNRYLQFCFLAAALWAGPTQGATFDVQLSGTSFTPANLSIQIGDTVRWVHVEGTHTTTSNDGLWNSPITSVSTTFSFTFNLAGTFSYFCQPHLAFGMIGSVTVTAPDITSPNLTLIAVEISGTVSDDSATLTQFTANGSPVVVSSGTFTYEHVMNSSAEIIAVIAEDSAGNVTQRDIMINAP